MLSITSILLTANLLVVIGYWLSRKKTDTIESTPSNSDNSSVVEISNTNNEELNKLSSENEQYKKQVEQLLNEKQSVELEKKKHEEKSKKTWAMSEAVYKEKKKVDEQNELLQVEKTKLEGEKKKVEEKVKKLWNQSMAIHKEKERINEIKLEIEKKHTEIVDSVNYAKRIQEAILPDIKEIDKHLPLSFILFKPRDIVSGDFYWFSFKEGKGIIAAIDCTGHGVPGAFMSMIGNTLLNQIVNERGVTDPAEILDNLNAEVNRSLKQNQEDSESRDGMDGAICCFEFEETNGIKKIKNVLYAGANRPLYFIRNNELTEIKANKFPVGGIDLEIPKKFTTHTLELQENDTIYIFTDGYADQFGITGKKLMTKKFKETLLAIQQQAMEEQKSHLDNHIETWKGKEEQTDDILVIGVKA
jgi:serine phosphatase RsbU (regulator of sigma subunit)